MPITSPVAVISLVVVKSLVLKHSLETNKMIPIYERPLHDLESIYEMAREKSSVLRVDQPMFAVAAFHKFLYSSRTLSKSRFIVSSEASFTIGIGR